MDSDLTARFTRPAGDPEVLVVGAGVAGLIAAWRAAETGASVMLLDASTERPPASGVAAGMIAPVGEATWGEETLLGAALAAAEGWPGFAQRLEEAGGVEVPYRRCGSIHVAVDRDEAAELERRTDLHARLDLRSERLLGSECRRLEPALATSVVAGISAPEEAEVEPRALLEALAAAAAGSGASLLPGTATSIEPDRGIAEIAGGERIEAGEIVFAAGAWAGRTEIGGGRLPIRPVKGEILRLRAPRGERLCERIIVGERFYLVPRADAEMVLGATVEERGFDLTVSAGGVHELLREAYRAVPDLAECELAEISAGLRPGSPDNAPLLGRVGERLIVATGLYRNGILLAPMVAAGIEAALRRDSMPTPLEGLKPDRFDLTGGRVEGPG